MSESEQWQAKWHGLQDILGPKWTLHILRLLSEESYGFNAIQNELHGLTAPMLSKRLKELRCHGLVERSVAETSPPTTTYSLSDRGEQIATHLRKLESLVELHNQTADDHQTDDCSDTAAECRTEALSDGCVTVVDQC
ncbi:winged helix-turn-helix transcriptional regulator [Natronorubrum thiooxidans]|uniref:Transcriptional regulator, HxlR family n=1 Tax=Natronorubrum thiooxidans TaxID=308853 RepID=A0A1N7GMK4_9EURY|nr:helix-turn-helix domain-containing protein [Natronorubrum thiooxidans]SIS13817.1 transcriptional regulator, HxlR family [Natronorubrum thiooxidans]